MYLFCACNSNPRAATSNQDVSRIPTKGPEKDENPSDSVRFRQITPHRVESSRTGVFNDCRGHRYIKRAVAESFHLSDRRLS